MAVNIVWSLQRQPDSTPVVIAYDDTDAVTYHGNWTNGITEDFDASLQIAVYSEGFTLKLGTDDDRSLCDVYVDNVFWGSLDTYAATPGELAVTIPLARLGLHVVEIRNRPERNKAAMPTSSTSFKLEFKQLETAYDGHSIDYTYDDLSRLLAADYFTAWDGVNPVRDYTFAYDVAGNRLTEVVNVDGSPFSSQTHTYDAANRISSAGFAYDNAGRMTSDGTNTYSWDRASRLLGMDTAAYAYNGLGQRVQQTVSGVVTDYLLDVQPGLAKVIAATTGANTERYVHERGLLSQQDSAGDWQWMVTDGLGSVRGVVDGGFDAVASRHFAPYGVPYDEQGTFTVPFAFTGEPMDDNGLVHLRARYYNPALGVFPSVDVFEGSIQQPTSLNLYCYVVGNPIKFADPTGHQASNDPRQGSCDNARFEWLCLQEIMIKLRILMTGGYATGTPAADFMYHYLYGESLSNIRRRPIYFEPDSILAQSYFMAGVNDKLKEHTFGSIRTSGISQLLGLIQNVDNTLIPSPPLDVTVTPWEERNIRFLEETRLYPAFGGSAIRTYDDRATIQITERQGDNLIVSVSQRIEFYDFYDWCGTDPGCQPDAIDEGLLERQPETGGLGTPDHPFGMYVGDFTALEKAGMAKTFDIYSSWWHSNVYSVFWPCGSPCQIDASLATLQETNTYAPLHVQIPHDYNPLSTGEVGDLEQNGYQVSLFFGPSTRPY